MGAFFKAIEFLITSERQTVDPIIPSTQLSLGKFRYSKRSLGNLHSADKKLQNLFYVVINRVDCTIIESYRNKTNQDKYFLDGKSKVKWPLSRHNSFPSKAIDVAPYPIEWHNTERFHNFAKIVIEEAKNLDINIRWGGDWNGNGDTTDQTFNDLCHWELK